ncbi:hypothetical protein ERJ75_001639600 [Trypanosoma vivax]|nr:hypothetical protein ERJ75_001639600 [Trypanosoma vivax]
MAAAAVEGTKEEEKCLGSGMAAKGAAAEGTGEETVGRLLGKMQLERRCPLATAGQARSRGKRTNTEVRERERHVRRVGAELVRWLVPQVCGAIADRSFGRMGPHRHVC